MSNMILLPDDLYAKLSKAAHRAGQPLAALVAEMLTRGLAQSPATDDPIVAVMRALGPSRRSDRLCGSGECRAHPASGQ